MRYEGRTEAAPSAEGWHASLSPATAARGGRPPLPPTLGLGADGKPLTPEGTAAPLADPASVRLQITSAPAHFCLPQKNDRQFKPAFHVQVRLTPM